MLSYRPRPSSITQVSLCSAAYVVSTVYNTVVSRRDHLSNGRRTRWPPPPFFQHNNTYCLAYSTINIGRPRISNAASRTYVEQSANKRSDCALTDCRPLRAEVILVGLQRPDSTLCIDILTIGHRCLDIDLSVPGEL